jgi:hypothetical protein
MGRGGRSNWKGWKKETRGGWVEKGKGGGEEEEEIQQYKYRGPRSFSESCHEYGHFALLNTEGGISTDLGETVSERGRWLCVCVAMVG